ncbi:hypothetical protein ZWY2020_032442 [Hordeum vulgare]|nr:hypothetical protein ZWY2020_032442 [Hordeum vulgare]
MDSVKNYVTGEAILERNLRLLLTWYYKKFRVHQLDSSISYESRLRQLIQNWSEEKAKKVDNIIQNNYLGVGEYVEDLMMPFIPAQDGTLAKPKTDARVVDAAIQIMRHDEPIDTRDGQFVYIERVAVVAKLERDGRIEKCYEDALAGIAGTTQGTNYLKHDMVFLPTRSLYVHWFLVVVNPRRKEIQVLDSLLYCMVRGMEAHLRAAMRINGIEINALEDINVTQWLVRDIIVSKGNESALYMLKNIELFTGEKLRMQYDQAYINKFRRELHVVLVGSRYNKMKYKKRFKQYHARLSDVAAVEDDEDARS